MSAPVVYYDGLCALCDRFVRFVVDRDRLARYRFAPLQGETARARLAGRLSEDAMKSVVLQEFGRVRIRSDAAIAIVAGLGWPWRAVAALRLVPRPARDWVYDWIARHRYRWFGTRQACRIPAAGERHRFLP